MTMCINCFRGYKTSTGRNAASRFSLMAHTSGEGKAMRGDGADGSTPYIPWGVANLHDMVCRSTKEETKTQLFKKPVETDDIVT